MMNKSKQDTEYLVVLRKIAQKGFVEILQHVNNKKGLHYNDILFYAIDNNIVKSKSSVTIILNGLTDLGLLNRIVSSTRPIRTQYNTSKMGKNVLKGLKAFEREMTS